MKILITDWEGETKIITENKNAPLKQKLWENWLTNKNNDAANDLVNYYMYLVTYHIERIAFSLPNNVSRDDLMSFALMGLFDALNKFEPERNLKFDTYASFRIRGSIIDGLRKEDWLPRSLREKTKEIELVTAELEQIHQRAPSSEEIAGRLGISSDEVETTIKDSLFANVLSIEQKPKEGDSEHKDGIGYIIPDEKTVLPAENMLNMEVKEEISKGIKSLNENEQLIISLFYHDELTMTEIGEIVGLTTSRISQIHKKAIFKLRNSLRKMQEQL